MPKRQARATALAGAGRARRAGPSGSDPLARDRQPPGDLLARDRQPPGDLLARDRQSPGDPLAQDGGGCPEQATQADGGRQAVAGSRPDHDERFPHEVLGVVLQVRRQTLQVLLWRRGAPPFEGLWSLPGGPLGASERLGTSLGRHLAAKVDLAKIAHLEQLETRSDPGRDPRGRVLATAYLALVSADVEPRIPGDTCWHAVQDLPPTAFDHGSIVESARERLRAKLSYTNIGFALAPETFTIARLRDIYAAALGHPVSATNLQRILTRRGVIEATAAAARPTAAGGRPATLYRFPARALVVTNPFAAFRPPSRPPSSRSRSQARPPPRGGSDIEPATPAKGRQGPRFLADSPRHA